MEKETNTNAAERSSVKMWPGILSGVIIGLIAFILSFDALRLVFVACGINPYLSWGGPVCVDGTILLCTWATWGFKKGHIRGAWYPWAGLVLFSGFSIGGNALHAIINTGYELPSWVPPVIMSIPPIALLYATHLIVIIAGDRLDKVVGAPVGDAPEPAAKDAAEPAPALVPIAAERPASVAPAAAHVVRTAPVDLSDWRVTVPDMEADARPKAFGADASDAEASTTIAPAEGVAGDEDVPAEPEPSPVEPDAQAAASPSDEGEAAGTPAPDGETTPSGKDAPTTDGGEPGDDEWNAWLDRMGREGREATARMAMEAGLASSVSVAKRHLARISRQRAERA